MVYYREDYKFSTFVLLNSPQGLFSDTETGSICTSIEPV